MTYGGPTHNIASSPGQLFLYPVIEPSQQGAWVAKSAYPKGAATGIRTSNVVMPIDGNGDINNAVQAATYGNVVIDKTFFENDAVLDSMGNIVVLVTPVTARPNQQVESTVSIYSSTNQFHMPSLISGVTGSSYSLIGDQAALYMLGAGILGISKDDGRTWSLKHYGLPGYPASRYPYAVAQTLQARSGTAYPQSGISFFQELIELSTNQ